MTFIERVEKFKREMLRDRPPAYLPYTLDRKSPRTEAALQLVEDGQAHATKAKGSGRQGWHVHLHQGENGPGYPHTSLRNLGDLPDDD